MSKGRSLFSIFLLVAAAGLTAPYLFGQLGNSWEIPAFVLLLIILSILVAVTARNSHS